jgi:hypothetical protein
MLAMHAHAGFGGGAHVIHLAIVGVGILGLVALLTPHFLAAPHTADEHETRVRALRTALDTHGPAASSSRDGRLLRAPALTSAQRVLLPLAAVSSAAAAGAHAAVAPQHFRESLLFGAFFVGVALAQLAWAGATAVRSDRALLVVGAAGNLAVIGLWVVTRTVGLPFGLLTRPEPVGPWDLACAGWELVVAGACIAALEARDATRGRLVSWRFWHPALPTYVAASALLLVALSQSGAGA